MRDSGRRSCLLSWWRGSWRSMGGPPPPARTPAEPGPFPRGEGIRCLDRPLPERGRGPIRSRDTRFADGADAGHAALYGSRQLFDAGARGRRRSRSRSGPPDAARGSATGWPAAAQPRCFPSCRSERPPRDAFLHHLGRLGGGWQLARPTDDHDSKRALARKHGKSHGTPPHGQYQSEFAGLRRRGPIRRRQPGRCRRTRLGPRVPVGVLRAETLTQPAAQPVEPGSSTTCDTANRPAAPTACAVRDSRRHRDETRHREDGHGTGPCRYWPCAG